MDIYLAGTYGRPYVVEELMDFYLGSPHSEIRKGDREACYGDVNLYLAGPNAGNINADDKASCFEEPGLMILESFYYVDDWMLPYIDKGIWKFMLDSGAFTFMDGHRVRRGGNRASEKFTESSGSTNWEDYVRRYADFIVEHGVDLFFELDIDVVVGLPRVNQLRDLLEKRTGKRAIPVWHKPRGLEVWKQLVRDYDYVAIGGIVSGEIKRAEHKFFNGLCDLAHAEQTRVHGLGVSPFGREAGVVGSMSGLKKYRFDSVDSTNWTMGNRAGYACYFDGHGISRIKKPAGTKMAAREAAKHNFREWVKYQRYMRHAGWRMEP